MKTLYDLGMAFTKIREALDSIEVRGRRNAAYVVYAVDLCNDAIKAINAMGEERGADGQNGDQKGAPGGEKLNGDTD